MTTPNQILVLLLSSASTAAGLGDKLNIPMLVAKAICERLESSGLVNHTHVGAIIPLYHLTDVGKDSANQLQASA
jgi:predicted ArsR family transcriptional regulator